MHVKTTTQLQVFKGKMVGNWEYRVHLRSRYIRVHGYCVLPVETLGWRLNQNNQPNKSYFTNNKLTVHVPSQEKTSITNDT